MPTVQFTDVPYYSYISGQDDLVQYGVVTVFNGSTISFERFNYEIANVSTFVNSLQNTVNITRADYANQSNLARDVGTGVTKTFANFVTHFREFIGPESDVTDVVLDVSVASYQTVSEDDDQNVLVTTFRGGVRAPISTSLMTIFSSVNNVRS